MALKMGDILNNRYRILAILGQGGFGAVYRAADMRLKRPCAVKENLDTSEEAQRQFEKEAIILAQLMHPNLPRVQDHFIIPGQGQYLVMDFIAGEDLQSLLERSGPVKPKQALNWIGQIANALAYLHAQNPPVIHRDIKPANIRITPEGKAVLVDFGLVKVYDPHLRTTVGARAVTPGYSPPEQYGQGNTDARTDIYALGATLYTLLTGVGPQESVLRVVEDQLAPAETINPQIPPSVSQAVRKAMDLKPSQRYQQISEFERQLQAASQKPVTHPRAKQKEAKPPHSGAANLPPPPRKAKTNWRKWALPAGAMLVIGALLLLFLAGIAFIGIQNQANERAAATAQARARATATAQARKDFIASLERSGLRVFGPAEGCLKHEEDDLVEVWTADVSLRDFIAEAVFHNPYSTAAGSWDYGFLFRDERSNNQYRLTVFSDGSWGLGNQEDATFTDIARGRLNNLDTTANGSNSIKVIASGNQGWLYINHQFVAELDLSDRTNAGDITVATGIWNGDEINGEETCYDDFTVWSIQDADGPDGQMEYGARLHDSLTISRGVGLWAFSGSSGDRITIELSSDDFDTYLELYGPNGEYLISDDDGGTDTNSRIADYRLPSSGQYIILVRSFNNDETGSYTLSLDGP